MFDRSSVRGPARVLLATLAALADESGSVDELCTDDLFGERVPLCLPPARSSSSTTAADAVA